MHLGQLESSASSAECGALELQSNYCYIQTEIYEPKSIEIKIVSSRQRSQLIGHTIFFPSEKRRIEALIGYIIIFTSEQNRVARSLLLLTDK